MGDKTYKRLASALVSRFTKTKPNSIYKEQDFCAKITKAIDKNTYFETVKDNILPDADTVNLKIKANSGINPIRKILKEKSSKLLKNLKEPFYLVFDSTYIPFYGRKKDKWIHEYTNNTKGATGSYKFLSCFVLTDTGQRFFVDACPLSVFFDEKKEVINIIDWITKELKKHPKITLFDRGYYSSALFYELNKRGIRYLMLVPKRNEIKKFLHEKFDEDENNRQCFNSAFAVKNTNIQLVYYREQKDLNEHIDWLFATNVCMKKYIHYIRVYKKRWNIETGFRVADEATAKTKSSDIVVRFFLFACSFILYNLWKEFYPGCSFKRFISANWEEIVLGLEFRKGVVFCLLFLCGFNAL